MSSSCRVDRAEVDQCAASAKKLTEVAETIQRISLSNERAKAGYVQNFYIWNRIDSWYRNTLTELERRRAILAPEAENRCPPFNPQDFKCVIFSFIRDVLDPQINAMRASYNTWLSTYPRPTPPVMQPVPDFNSNFSCAKCEQCTSFNNLNAAGNITIAGAQSCVLQLEQRLAQQEIADQQQQLLLQEQRAREYREQLAREEREAMERQLEYDRQYSDNTNNNADTNSNQATHSGTEKTKGISPWILIFLFILAVLTIGVGVYFYMDSTDAGTSTV